MIALVFIYFGTPVKENPSDQLLKIHKCLCFWRTKKPPELTMKYQNYIDLILASWILSKSTLSLDNTTKV